MALKRSSISLFLLSIIFCLAYLAGTEEGINSRTGDWVESTAAVAVLMFRLWTLAKCCSYYFTTQLRGFSKT